MPLTLIHRTWNVLPSTKTHLQSIFPLPYDIYLHLSLIYSCLNLLKAMRTNFYRGLSDTEDDGGGLQWNLSQDVESVT